MAANPGPNPDGYCGASRTRTVATQDARLHPVTCYLHSLRLVKQRPLLADSTYRLRSGLSVYVDVTDLSQFVPVFKNNE